MNSENKIACPNANLETDQSQNDQASANDRTKLIRCLNDRLRRDGTGGQWLVTQGVSSLPHDQLKAVLKAVVSFDKFTPDNDPHGEHDFASVEVDGISVMWKIDYCDKQMELHSPDPTDPKVTRRVLTLMLASEY